jgi:hypothetical protein
MSMVFLQFNNLYMHTCDSCFIFEGVAEEPQIPRRRPRFTKMFNYSEYCKRDRLLFISFSD